MDYGGIEKRKTKKDLKRKRLARGYKRGGRFRTQEVSVKSSGENVIEKKGKKGKKKR